MSKALKVEVKESSSNIFSPPKNILFGVGVTNASEDNILEYIIKIIQNTDKNYYIVTPNPEIIVSAIKNDKFRKVLNEAELALCDGVGLYMASKILGKSIKERITGTDLVDKLCERVSNYPITVGFLGGRSGIANQAAKCLQEKYFTLEVVYISEEWKETDKNKEGKESEKKDLTKSARKIDILFVAFGHPKQEEWMSEHINKIPAQVMIGVGGALDYVSGSIPRAPKFIRAIGFEWLYRLLRQPWRIKRQFALIEFVYFLIKEKISKS